MRRFVFTLVLLVVMSPTMAMAAEWYRCTMDGQARSACCCPGEAEEEQEVPADASPDASAACCCDIETASTPASNPRIALDASFGAVVVPRAVVEVQLPPAPVAVFAAHAVTRPSSRAPPLFLSNCALLL